MKSYEETYDGLKTIYGDDTLMIDIQQLSKLTGLSTGTIKNYINSGNLLPKYFKLGRGKNSSIRFYLSDVATYLYSLQLISDKNLRSEK